MLLPFEPTWQVWRSTECDGRRLEHGRWYASRRQELTERERQRGMRRVLSGDTPDLLAAAIHDQIRRGDLP